MTGRELWAVLLRVVADLAGPRATTAAVYLTAWMCCVLTAVQSGWPMW